MLNFENLDKFAFPGVGKYGVPEIAPVTEYPAGEFIPVNYHYTAKDPESKNVHFFVDDYQFVRYWNTPDKYIPKLKTFGAVCAPDFSTYTDMPLAMQIYNHYRKHWENRNVFGEYSIKRLLKEAFKNKSKWDRKTKKWVDR